MIKTFCDGCEGEITAENGSDMGASAYAGAHINGMAINLRIMCVRLDADDIPNLCRSCVRRVINDGLLQQMPIGDREPRPDVTVPWLTPPPPPSLDVVEQPPEPPPPLTETTVEPI